MTRAKLYDVPRYSTIRLPDGTELDFHHIDGMYSFCTDKDGRVHHIAAWSDVEIISPYEQKPASMSAHSNNTKKEQA
jgi:hypothetical protein